MKTLCLLLLALWSVAAQAKTINFELKFTPYLGDPATADSVKVVPGKAAVFINNVPLAEQDIAASEAMVLFDEREISPAVWVPASSLGSLLRTGINTVRIVFTAADSTQPFHSQLSWAEVSDQTTQQSSDNSMSATNQQGEGKENKEAQGQVVLEKTFTADFAKDEPWHHYPVVTALSEHDKQQLIDLVNERAKLFQPKFDGIYQLIAQRQAGLELDLKKLRKMACLDKAYAAGVRIAPQNLDELDITLSGNQEVIIKGKSGTLYNLSEKDFAKIKGQETQMCAGMTLSIIYPPRLIVVKNPNGAWETVH